jgi:hypothetical protein
MVKRESSKLSMGVRFSLFPRPISLAVKALPCHGRDRRFKSDIGRKPMIQYIYGGKDE